MHTFILNARVLGQYGITYIGEYDTLEEAQAEGHVWFYTNHYDFGQFCVFEKNEQRRTIKAHTVDINLSVTPEDKEQFAFWKECNGF